MDGEAEIGRGKGEAERQREKRSTTVLIIILQSQVEKIFPVTRIKIYPYFYDPFLPNSSRALRNFKNLCFVPVYTRNGPVTVHVIKLLLVEKIPLYCSQLTFFPLISRNFFW